MEHHNPRVIALGHQAIMPYLIVEGADGFIEFARKVFFMEIQTLTRRNKDLIAHAELRNEGSTVMLADATAEWPAMPSSMFIYVDDTDEIFETALKEGASVLMKPSDQPYGRAAGIRDPWGNVWWLTSLPEENES